MRPMGCQRWIAVSDARSIGVEVERVDVDFARAHERACPGCGAESALWRSLSAVEAHPPDESGQRLTRLVLEEVDSPTTLDRVLAEAKRSPPGRASSASWRGRSAVAAAVVLAGSMAAGALVELRVRSSAARATVARSIPVEIPAATPPALAGATETAVAPAAHAAPAYRCEAPAADITVCVEGAAKYRTEEPVGRRRVLDLSGGRVVVALGPQRKGASFVVATPYGRVTAVGTVFSVEAAASGGAWARVERGKVRVARIGAKDTSTLHAGQEMRLDDSSRPVTLSEAERSRDLAALTIEVADTESAPAPRPIPMGAARSGVPTASHEGAPSNDGRGPADGDASTTLARARALLGRGDFAAAAASYQRAYEEAPATAEGGAALVSLGDLRLSELGDPRGALAAFDAYLARGAGVLTLEAEFGRIGALRALGRREEERTAARAFLNEHPSGPESDSVRRHLEN